MLFSWVDYNFLNSCFFVCFKDSAKDCTMHFRRLSENDGRVGILSDKETKKSRFQWDENIVQDPFWKVGQRLMKN